MSATSLQARRIHERVTSLNSTIHTRNGVGIRNTSWEESQTSPVTVRFKSLGIPNAPRAIYRVRTRLESLVAEKENALAIDRPALQLTGNRGCATSCDVANLA